MNSTYRSNHLSKAWNRIITAVLLLLLVLSCSFFSGSVKESTEPGKDIEDRIKTEGFIVKSVTIKKSFDSEIVRENAQYALSILVPERETPAGSSLQAEVVLKEESFIKGFKQLNSVSLELIIRETDESIVRMVLVSEETENTLSSYRYLYKILEKGIREIGM